MPASQPPLSIDDHIFELPPPGPPPLPRQKGDERREWKRMPYVTLVRVLRGAEVLKAHSEDICEGGLMISLHEKLNEGETVVVRFAPPFSASSETLRARVQWSRPAASGPQRNTAGLSFQSVTDAARTRIAAYTQVETETMPRLTMVPGK